MSEDKMNASTAYLETWTKLFINQQKTVQRATMFSILISLILLAISATLMSMQKKIVTFPDGKDVEWYLWYLNDVTPYIRMAKSYFFFGFSCALVSQLWCLVMNFVIMKKIETNDINSLEKMEFMKIRSKKFISHVTVIAVACSYVFMFLGVAMLLLYLNAAIDPTAAVFPATN